MKQALGASKKAFISVLITPGRSVQTIARVKLAWIRVELLTNLTSHGRKTKVSIYSSKTLCL